MWDFHSQKYPRISICRNAIHVAVNSTMHTFPYCWKFTTYTSRQHHKFLYKLWFIFLCCSVGKPSWFQMTCKMVALSGLIDTTTLWLNTSVLSEAVTYQTQLHSSTICSNYRNETVTWRDTAVDSTHKSTKQSPP